MLKTAYKVEKASSSHSDPHENLPPCPLGRKEFSPSHRHPCASALLSGWTAHIMKILCQLALSPQVTDCERMSIYEYNPVFIFHSSALFAQG